MTATIQQVPPDHRGGYDLERDEVVATADDYDRALAGCVDQMPTGWRIVHVQVDRD